MTPSDRMDTLECDWSSCVGYFVLNHEAFIANEKQTKKMSRNFAIGTVLNAFRPRAKCAVSVGGHTLITNGELGRLADKN